MKTFLGTKKQEAAGPAEDRGPAAMKTGPVTPEGQEQAGKELSSPIEGPPKKANPQVEATAEQVRQALEREIGNGLRAKVEARDGLARLEAVFEKYRRQKEELESEIGRLIGSSTEALARGEKAKDAELRKAKADVIEADAWIERLEKQGIPEAVEKLKSAKKALADAFQVAVPPVHEVFRQRMEKAIGEAADLFLGWSAGVKLYHESAGNKKTDFGEIQFKPPWFFILKIKEQSPELRIFAEHVFFEGMR